MIQEIALLNCKNVQNIVQGMCKVQNVCVHGGRGQPQSFLHTSDSEGSRLRPLLHCFLFRTETENCQRDTKRRWPWFLPPESTLWWLHCQPLYIDWSICSKIKIHFWTHLYSKSGREVLGEWEEPYACKGHTWDINYRHSSTNSPGKTQHSGCI